MAKREQIEKPKGGPKGPPPAIDTRTPSGKPLKF